MYAPTVTDFDETVALSKAHGIDPHDVTLALFIESGGYNPASMGPKQDGAVSGLNQMSKANLASLGLTPAAWTAMTAAQQLPAIFNFWVGLAKSFAGGAFPADAAHLLALNFVPAYYQSSGAAKNPAAPLVSKNDTNATKAAIYAANTFYDPGSTGVISVNTIAARQAQQKAAGGARWAMLSSGIDAAIARAAAAAPTPVPGPPPAAQPPPVILGALSPQTRNGVASAGVLALIASIVYAILRARGR
jgi:hypothetical protein